MKILGRTVTALRSFIAVTTATAAISAPTTVFVSSLCITYIRRNSLSLLSDCLIISVLLRIAFISLTTITTPTFLTGSILVLLANVSNFLWAIWIIATRSSILTITTAITVIAISVTTATFWTGARFDLFGFSRSGRREYLFKEPKDSARGSHTCISGGALASWSRASHGRRLARGNTLYGCLRTRTYFFIFATNDSIGLELTRRFFYHHIAKLLLIEAWIIMP